jgi:hypothetical protein
MNAKVPRGRSRLLSRRNRLLAQQGDDSSDGDSDDEVYDEMPMEGSQSSAKSATDIKLSTSQVQLSLLLNELSNVIINTNYKLPNILIF